MNLKISLLSILLSLIIIKIHAQNFYGYSSSNNAGSNGIYINPAEASFQKKKVNIDFLGLNANSYWNKDVFSIKEILNDGVDSFLNRLGRSNNLDGLKTNTILESRPLGLNIFIAQKLGLGISTRSRFFIQSSNFSQQLFDILYNQNYQTNGTTNLNMKNIKFGISNLSDIGINASYPIFENNNFQIVAGGTFRIYKSIGYAGFNINSAVGSKDSNDVVNIQSIDMEAYTGDNLKNLKTINDQFFDPNIGFGKMVGNLSKSMFQDAPGSGFGGDIGAIMIKKPKNNNKLLYRYKVGVSLLDLGNITFKNAQVVSIRNSNPVSFFIDTVKINTASIDTMSMDLKDLGFQTDLGLPRKKTFNLPSTFSLQMDYALTQNLYLNLNTTLNLHASPSYGPSIPSTVFITPRFQSELLDISLPLGYNITYSKPSVGLGLRAYMFFIGTQDLGTFMGSKKQSSLYLGFHTGFGNVKHKKHIENDKIKNTLEQNKTTNNITTIIKDTIIKKETIVQRDTILIRDTIIKEAQIPDTDGDGVNDNLDKCPTVKGLALYGGCPDTDGDGTEDAYDDCPTLAGPIALKGCPDDDNDGIPNKEDKCPNVAGSVENKGCPVIKETVKKRIALAASAIQFETGSDVIKTSSYTQLNELVNILNEYQDYSMKIEGYTDNVGAANKNLLLSQKRAESVKNYFISKSINSNRLKSTGFGIANPIATNSTPEGRAKNRRVEMDLFLSE